MTSTTQQDTSLFPFALQAAVDDLASPTLEPWRSSPPPTSHDSALSPYSTALAHGPTAPSQMRAFPGLPTPLSPLQRLGAALSWLGSAMCLLGSLWMGLG